MRGVATGNINNSLPVFEFSAVCSSRRHLSKEAGSLLGKSMRERAVQYHVSVRELERLFAIGTGGTLLPNRPVSLLSVLCPSQGASISRGGDAPYFLLFSRCAPEQGVSSSQFAFVFVVCCLLFVIRYILWSVA